MPSMSGRISVGIGGTSGNVLTGQQYELAPFDGNVEFLAVSTVNLVTCSIFSGSDILIQPGGAVPISATENAPVYPDHVLAEDEVAEGDRLNFTFVNGNAGAAIVNWRVMISP